MRHSDLALAVLALLAGAAAAARAPGLAAPGAAPPGGADGPAGRQLLQASPNATDCDRSVKNCVACRYQFYRGTITKAICTRCAIGYNVKASGRACYCAPGFYTRNDTAVSGDVGFTCDACGPNAYCPGAMITPESSASRAECGAFKVTTTLYGRSDRECVVSPGHGWGPGDSSAPCAQGWYNPGFNTRKCTKCPGSLTTLGGNSNSSQDCVAPAGHYYLRGKAVACAQGTYKADIANTDCDECPEGFTTQPGRTAQTSAGACTYILPGFEVKASGSAGDAGVRTATECPDSTYRTGFADWANASYAAVVCTACPPGMLTLPNVTKSTSADACLAPPGYGWLAAGGGGGAGNASLCAAGSYNPGWNREPCVACGGGSITTDGPGSTSADDCYTPAGHGTRRDVTGALEGAACPADTYGRANHTYGLVDVECTKCLEHTSTTGEGSTAAAECLTVAGYGYEDGQVLQCDYGYWSAGGTQNPCTYCGALYNTTADGATDAAAGRLGADSADDCKPDFGFTNDTAAGLKPCIRGTYKDTLGWAECTQCPNATTTTIVFAAGELSDCDACRPGFGSNTSINLEAPLCTICASGTYSPGFVSGGAACTACPKPSGYTGNMVSRRGVWTPEECVGEFSSDASMQNFMPWDVIPMTTLEVSNDDTVEDCHAACEGSPRCQYYEFYDYPDPGARCFLRLADADIGKVEIVEDGPGAGSYVLFEIDAARYVVYAAKSQADADSIGNTLATNFTSRASALAECDSSAACVGATFSAATLWRTFGAALWEGAVGRVRAVGETINSWVPEPSAAPV
ncbi:MAG: hypothetical protein J3K34DRAFT_523771 [Monoraphidium minutum]|nr:MAG: hypothetical protein J3K34DRAFT_523771 [Monoraphidium minutum]